MSIALTWTQDDGKWTGVLTKKALPDTAGRELPIIIRTDGAGITPNDLRGTVLQCTASQAAMYPELIRDAKEIGYDIRTR
jgi:hypothetical protein